jgi:hypothetical protein
MVHITLVAHDQAATIVHPREAPPHLPAVAITGAGSDRPPAFGTLPTACHRRDNGLNPAPAQLLAKGLAVITSVGDQFPGPCPRAPAPLGHVDGRQGRLGQRAFMGACTRHMRPDRQPTAVGHYHHFRALADCGLADAGAPFFAGTKLPSRKACAHSSLPWASSWLNNIRQIRSQVPSRDQVWKRRQHVTGEPYMGGTSAQVHPIFSTKRMPLSVRRSSFRFRPGPDFCWGDQRLDDDPLRIREVMSAHAHSLTRA